VAPEDATCWVDDVAAVADLLSAGVSSQTIRRRLATGRWQRPCSTVVCRTTGTLTTHQDMVVALAHAGPGAMISHATAGAFWGFDPVSGAAPRRPTQVTVPHGRRRPSTDTVLVHQSLRPCEPRLVEGLLVTPPARTAVDMALDLTTGSGVAAHLGRVLQRGRVSLDQLADELDQAPSRGSRLPRAALADLAVGSRSAGESRLLHLMRRAGLPLPELNAPVSTSIGTRYVDALWRELGKGVEVDGQAFHLDAESWQADLRRQNAIQSTGIVLLRIAARRLWTEPDAVIAEIRAFLGVPLS
jgi:very-short-patch-repair endonuclease